MNGWTANAERYLAEWYGETIYDQEPDMYELTSEQLARKFSHEIFVVGVEMSLGDFLTRLAEYGDARVREALAQREPAPTTG